MDAELAHQILRDVRDNGGWFITADVREACGEILGESAGLKFQALEMENDLEASESECDKMSEEACEQEAKISYLTEEVVFRDNLLNQMYEDATEREVNIQNLTKNAAYWRELADAWRAKHMNAVFALNQIGDAIRTCKA